MHRSLLKWWFILLAISRIQCGLIELWKSKNYGVDHRTMKMILDSCYENDSGANPTLIFGDFHEFIDKSSVIWLNRSFHLDINVEKEYSLKRTFYQPNKFILIVDSPEQLKEDLLLLASTRWWNPTALFFFIANNDNTCVNCAITLWVPFRMYISNSIYICTESGETRLFTFNPITNYAPSPWKRLEIVEYNIFSQPFNSEISCKNLHYDKTKVIHGYEIRFDGVLSFWMNEFIAGTYDLKEIVAMALDYVPLRLLDCVVESLNATGTVKFTYYPTDESGDKEYPIADMTGDVFAQNSLCRFCLIIYPEWLEVIAVIKKAPEISTLTKIRRLWAVPVLIAASVAIGILFIVLTALSHDFSSAMLDLIRLLTYTSILMNIRSHKFRIYFATMLIFMVISNGVFQGRIAAFLTTQERENPPASLDDLMKLKYKIYSPRGHNGKHAYVCPKCDIKIVTDEDPCIDVVLNNTRHACLMYKRHYETRYNLKPLDYVRISNIPHHFFITQPGFPLRDRIEKNVMRIFESGIMEMWINNSTYRQKTIRQEMEAEWSSPEYKPVKLYKLKFAFQVLALGLLISTIVYFVEILVAKYGKFCKVK